MTAAEFRATLAALQLRQSWLAERLGVSATTVNRWATGAAPVAPYVPFVLGLLHDRQRTDALSQTESDQMTSKPLRYCLGDVYGRIGYGDPVGHLYLDEATARAVAAAIPAERRRYGVYLYTTDDLRNHGDGTELYPPMPRDELVALIERERRDELAAFKKGE